MIGVKTLTMKKVFMFVNVDWFFFSHRLPIAQAAKNHNIEMSVYAEHTRILDQKQIHGFKLLDSPLRRISKSKFHFIMEFIKAYKIIKRDKPNLIHAVTIKPIIVLGIISRLTSTPFIGSISGLGPAFNSKTYFEKFRLFFLLKILGYIFLRKSVGIICQNSNDRDFFIRNGLFTKEEILLIHGSGVDLEQYSPSKKRINAEKYVLMSSRILSDKGIEDYCRAAEMVRLKIGNQIKFKLSGPIEPPSSTSFSEDEIKELVHQYGVEYLGDRSDMPELLASALLFVLPSFYSEGLPKVLLEASASGIPIITTDHPGCRDAIINNETGLLVPAKDPELLAKAIIDLLSDHSLLIAMGKNGRSLAEKSFQDSTVVNKHYSLYQQLL